MQNTLQDKKSDNNIIPLFAEIPQMIGCHNTCKETYWMNLQPMKNWL